MLGRNQGVGGEPRKRGSAGKEAGKRGWPQTEPLQALRAACSQASFPAVLCRHLSLFCSFHPAFLTAASKHVAALSSSSPNSTAPGLRRLGLRFYLPVPAFSNLKAAAHGAVCWRLALGRVQKTQDLQAHSGDQEPTQEWSREETELAQGTGGHFRDILTTQHP